MTRAFVQSHAMPTDVTTIPEIRVLPALVAAQIAAGEVVERPASIVKELIDNALDAGAQSISVEIEQGGIELVRVTDDGHGVPAAQLPLMLAAHATSKVRTADDLDRVTTMGFRGEALASIASVARVSIRSRTAGDTGASRIDAEGVSVTAVRPESGPVGTSVGVRNLFFNTPARRKFLKSPGTEQGHCADVTRDLAMAHPRVAFTLKIDGRTAFELPRDQSARERSLSLLGRELESQFIEASADRFDDPRGAALWGLIALPALARPTPRSQHVFINGRPIRDRTIQHALKEAYRGLIEPGRHPTAVLHLVMDPGAVDVNVHPAKAEVRFRDSSLVHQTVYHAAREALRRADLTPSATESTIGGGGSLRLTAIEAGGGTAVEAEPRAVPAARFVEYFRRADPGPHATGRFEYAPVRTAVAPEASAGNSNGPDGAETVAPPASPEPPTLSTPVPAERVLQVHNSYLVTQDAHGVVIIDQHALHERVMFEKLSARVGAGTLESQRLLMPVVVGASPGAVGRLAELKPVLETLGVVAEAIGPASVAVHAFPSFLIEKKVEPGEFLGDLLERAEAEPTAAGALPPATRREELLHEVLDMMACKAAVKAGDSLSDPEIAELLRLRDDVERSSNCPHGRPTAIRLSIRDIERSFGRA